MADASPDWLRADSPGLDSVARWLVAPDPGLQVTVIEVPSTDMATADGAPGAVGAGGSGGATVSSSPQPATDTPSARAPARANELQFCLLTCGFSPGEKMNGLRSSDQRNSHERPTENVRPAR